MRRDHGSLRSEVLGILEGAWNPAGYTSPNQQTYPWMWLWDSCFHAITWAVLDDERATVELESVFTFQDDDGFVPHMGYQVDPAAALDLWGRPGASTITQPPMFCHTARVLSDLGHPVDDALVERCAAGLRFLLRERRTEGGLIAVVHPWETGCDDSPRWDAWTEAPFQKPAWDEVKASMVRALVLTERGAAVGSPLFSVGSVMFTALVAFNAIELHRLTGDATWAAEAERLTTALEPRWSNADRTWVDEGGHSSAAAPTVGGLLPVLVHPERFGEVWGMLTDPDSFGARFGPREVDARYPTFDGAGYWRGATWPQMNYLLWLAAEGHADARSELQRKTSLAARASGFAEYWDPDSGEGHGARPQSWTSLAFVMEEMSR